MYVKSPLNYVGGKFKLLPQILPLFPEKIGIFVDLFGGGGNVVANVESHISVYNDIEEVVINLMKDLQKLGSKEALEILEATIEKYGLSKTNEEGFKRIREDYNNGNKSWDMFYAMLTHAFNYQIRFNSKGEYNMPFGRNRSSFNPSLRKNFVAFVDRLQELNLTFTDYDFRKFNPLNFSSNDLIYADPPYLITCASYNESGGWTEQDERDLLLLLDRLNFYGVKFALSNILQDGDKVNEILLEWSSKYNVHDLNYDYKNSNYQKKNKDSGVTREVLITNY